MLTALFQTRQRDFARVTPWLLPGQTARKPTLPQIEYFNRLSEPVQEFVREVEDAAGIEITVIPSGELNSGGPTHHGQLEIEIADRYIHIFAPTNGYFPDGAVRHELLHVHRFHVQGVPRLALAGTSYRDRGLADALTHLDNALEHMIIVPVELQWHPERREHWESVMKDVWTDAPYVPPEELQLAVCMHWTFLRQVLPDSRHIETASQFLEHHGLHGKASDFADKLLGASQNKEKMVGILLQTFPEIPAGRSVLEYVNRLSGTRQQPIARIA